MNKIFKYGVPFIVGGVTLGILAGIIGWETSYFALAGALLGVGYTVYKDKKK